jgi:competence protein ComEA
MVKLPSFSRAQQGVILLLGAGLLLLWAWRAHFFRAAAPSPPGRLHFIFVEVCGNVAHPGVYVFERSPTLSEAVEKAGGRPLALPANPPLVSGARIEVREQGLPMVSRMAGAQLLTLGLPLDLNTASAADLEALPGLGPALAQRIVDYRRQHGPFKKIEDLEQVPGLGPKKLERLKPQLIITADERR